MIGSTYAYYSFSLSISLFRLTLQYFLTIQLHSKRWFLIGWEWDTLHNGFMCCRFFRGYRVVTIDECHHVILGLVVSVFYFQLWRYDSPSKNTHSFSGSDRRFVFCRIVSTIKVQLGCKRTVIFLSYMCKHDKGLYERNDRGWTVKHEIW